MGGSTVVIRNTKTGETREINPAEAQRYGIQAPQQTNEQPIERQIGKTGAFDIPLLGGLLRGAVGSTESYGRMGLGAGYEGVRAAASALGDKNAYVDKQGRAKENPFLSMEDLAKFSPSEQGGYLNPLLEGAGRTANFGATVASGYGAPKLLSGLTRAGVKTGGDIARTTATLAKGGITKKGAANIATREAAKATKAGKAVHWNEITGEIRKSVTDKFGNTPEVKKSLNKLLAEKTPAGVESIPETMIKTPTDLIDWRRQISARGGSGFLQRIMKGSDIEGKVENEARRKISELLHELAPATKNPDSVYSFYSKIHGDAPKWARNIVGGAIIDQLFTGGKVRGLLGNIID